MLRPSLSEAHFNFSVQGSADRYRYAKAAAYRPSRCSLASSASQALRHLLLSLRVLSVRESGELQRRNLTGEAE